jgi:hypothetical protein
MEETTAPEHRDADPRVQAPQPVLPFDDAGDEPIAYSLTARARRTVAPDSLPPLAVVGRPAVPSHATAAAVDDGDLERPGDTRPARARALRRAGLSRGEIAVQLDVDPLLVDVWTADVHRSARRAPRRRGPAPAVAEAARAHAEAAPAPRDTAPSGTAPTAPRVPTARERDEAETAFALARADAARSGRSRLGVEADLAAGVGLLLGVARTDAHAITVTVPSTALAAHLVRWITHHLGVPADEVRVVLRLGPRVAGDLARHRWAKELGVPAERIAHARWRGAPTDDAEEAVLRIADPTAAATLAGWCDALVTPAPTEVDLAF